MAFEFTDTANKQPVLIAIGNKADGYKKFVFGGTKAVTKTPQGKPPREYKLAGQTEMKDLHERTEGKTKLVQKKETASGGSNKPANT